ncbi:MAG TPA: UDP-3-O-(3-hydroxymyristoyl)glucosamine N-acyltransferase [Pyrinomonadaceae bacterium]|nr:UDP-3-O-(3-hydroxymyristoyl)glucosamine N-acyltransferase [Pyrinomonadaceae bacterium]
MSGAKKSWTVAELAALVGGRAVGDGGVAVERVAAIAGAGAGDVVFAEDEKLLAEALAGGASCVVVPAGAEVGGRPAIEAARPKLAFALIAEALHPPARREAGVHPTAVVAPDARLGEGVHVGPRAVVGPGAQLGAGTQVLAGAVVGQGARVGRDCVLHPCVVLYEGVSLGDRVVLHAGVVVGADGFGYVRDEGGEYHKFPQIGTVVIEDDVELGAGTCVDRGALGETRVGRGTKIDNLVQVGHNVRIGERVVIAAQTGISGSTVIEDEAVIGGQVGMGDHARVERGAVVGSKAGILPGKIVRAGAVMWGVPVRPLEEYKRLNALWGRLPQMRAEIEELKRQVRELTERREEK